MNQTIEEYAATQNQTIEEYAATHRVSGATVLRWIKAKRLPARKMGKRTLIPAGARLDE